MFVRKLLRVVACIGAASVGIAESAEAATPSTESLPSCIAAVQALEAQEGTYTCVEEYSSEGRTFAYGKTGFFENIPAGTEIATVVSVGTQARAMLASGRQITRPIAAGESAGPTANGGRATKRKPSRSLTKALAASYQSYFEELVSYGAIQNGVYNQYGMVRLTHNINLNGRQVQNTPTLNVTTGPSVAPGLNLSSGCGSTSWGPVSARFTWYPGTKNTYCAGDGTFRNTNTWSWTTLGSTWTHANVSSSWQCNSVYTSPCWFGNR